MENHYKNVSIVESNNMNLQKIDFKKDITGKTILTDLSEIQKICKWVLPIIENNEGWGTGHLTKEKFLDNPELFQNEIDSTVTGETFIMMDSDNPIALIEFKKKVFPDTSELVHRLLVDLLSGTGINALNKLINEPFPQQKLPEIERYLYKKPLYSYVGVVIKPELQNKKLGISEQLYGVLADGLVLGYTSNPIVVRKRKSLFTNTLYFPLLNQKITSLEEWAACLYVYADRLESPEESSLDLPLGTLISEQFVEDRGEEAIQIAQIMANKSKITALDLKRIQFVLSKKFCAGAIVSWNS